VGRVAEVGAGVGLAPGARVFVHHHVPCFTCRLCRAGRHTLCPTFRATRIDPGGLAELIRVPEPNVRADVLVLPDDLPDLAATLIEPLGCVIHGLRLARVGPGARVAVVGAGAMGLLEVQAALALGAARVVAVEPQADRRALAEQAGATALADGSPGAVREALGGDLADAVIVCTSNRGAIAGALHLAGDAGVVQLFAPTPPGEIVGLDLGAVFFREVEIQSTYSAGPHDTRDALAMLVSGAVRWRPLLTHTVPLADVQEAFRLARSGEAMKVVVVP
ncbi:MAG: zinc-binding dehydrogenase, partial [Actinomycetota bacterium]